MRPEAGPGRSGVIRWRDQLAELGGLGNALRAAVLSDDVVAAIAAAVRIRQLRAELAPADDGELAWTSDQLAALADVAELIAPARAADSMLARWLARPLPGDAALLATPLGIATLADAMLPEVWDLARDVVVLVGDALAPVADVLADIGQRRIVRFAADRPLAELNVAIRTVQQCPPGRMVVRTELGVAPDVAAAIARTVEQAISDLRIQRNTVATVSRTWVDQGLANLPALARWPSIAQVGDRLRGLPLAIVAPGPSLARNAHRLRELRGRAVIAAFSHSLRPVIAAGVTPDLVIAVDPQDLRYHFAGCDVSRSYLVNAATVHPGLFELGARGCLGVASNARIDDWVYDGLGDDAVAAGGGSVATTALSLALRWGCDPVIFVGLDLSFSNDAYYVATSVDGGAKPCVDDDGVVRVDGWSDGFRTMRGHSGAAPGERVVELPGWHGGTVRSSFMFAMFHRWFVDRLAGDGLPTVFNCTEGGAFVDGMRHRPLADVIAELPHDVDGLAALDAVVAATDATARRARLTRHLTAQLRALARCRNLARRARRLAATADPRLTDVERRLAAELRAAARRLAARPARARAGDRPGAAARRRRDLPAGVARRVRHAARRDRPARAGAAPSARPASPRHRRKRAAMSTRRDGPRVVAVSGGKGGVGKSTIAANLALALGRLGHRVTLVDADLGAANLHTMLGVFHPPRTLADVIDGSVDSLDAIAQPCRDSTCRFVAGVARPGSANLGDDELARIIDAVWQADAECVIVDIGAGANHNVLDLVNAADIKLVVLTPQLTSLHNAYAMLKACVHRAVRSLAGGDTEQALVDSALGSEHRARTISQLLSVLRPLDGDVAERISSTLYRFGLGLIGNQLAGPGDAAMLERIGTMIRDHLAVHAPVMSTVPSSPTLAGGLKSRTALDDTLPPFRRLAAAVLDVDLEQLRASSRQPHARRHWARRAG